LADAIDVDYKSAASGFKSNGGTFTGTLISLDGYKLDLRLEKKKGASWTTMMSTSSAQTTSQSSTQGIYRWRVGGGSGGGRYTLCSETP